MMILKGDPGKLEMNIVSWIYPDVTDLENEDGKWLYVDFRVDVPCFQARICNTHVQIDELQILYNELDKALETIQDFRVDFWTIEDNLTMIAEPTTSGIILFNIIVKTDFNKLSFLLEVDIPSLERFTNELFFDLQKYISK